MRTGYLDQQRDDRQGYRRKMGREARHIACNHICSTCDWDSNICSVIKTWILKIELIKNPNSIGTTGIHVILRLERWEMQLFFVKQAKERQKLHMLLRVLYSSASDSWEQPFDKSHINQVHDVRFTYSTDHWAEFSWVAFISLMHNLTWDWEPRS